MKLAIFISLIVATMAFPGLSSVQTWLASLQQPIMNLIDNPRRKSTIPQFILDTNHPWILTNQRKLESLPNATAFLCFNPNLDSEKAINAPSTDLKVPLDLFDNLAIDNNRAGISRPGWPNAIERLTEINHCPRALAQAKSLHVDIFVHCNEYSDLWLRTLEPCQPPPEVPTLFGDVLESMTSLEDLNWGIPQDDAHFFEESFASRNLTFPCIKSLEPGALSQYLVGMCPNLEKLENGGGHNWNGYPDDHDWRVMFIESGALAPKLKRFAMSGSYDGWAPSLATEVVKSMPQIESLGLHGSLGRSNYAEKSDKLKDIMVILSALKNLTHVDLPSSSSLGLGFDGGHWCGNAYFGKEGREYGRQVSKEGAEATEKGVDIVLTNTPHLTSFTIGGRAPNITRADNGTVSLTWDWTGRMDEWLMEIWPEVPDFEDIEYGSMEASKDDENSE